jgi:hypothetical protein
MPWGFPPQACGADEISGKPGEAALPTGEWLIFTVWTQETAAIGTANNPVNDKAGLCGPA